MRHTFRLLLLFFILLVFFIFKSIASVIFGLGIFISMVIGMSAAVSRIDEGTDTK
jgi:hypothetical protein